MNKSSGRGHADIVAKVEFMRQPDSYPEPTDSVEVVETHRSWVFLTDRFAYKLKKPDRGDGFDFRSLDARRHNCAHEIRLNRRLAWSVYLSIAAITISENGRLSIEGDGETVEWLVKMRKLDRERMLDRCIANASVTAKEIESVGQLLCGFYRQSSPVDWSGAHYCHHLADSIANARFSLLERPLGLPPSKIDEIAMGLSDFVNLYRAELIQRVRHGHVIDAHGDLRPEHICLESPPVIIDCMEFNQGLRMLDAASELSFLAQECDLLGAVEVGQQLWQVYVERTGDHVSSDLRSFYRGYHALLRASLAIAHLRDEIVRQPEKWKPKAERYLDAAMIANLQWTHPS